MSERQHCFNSSMPLRNKMLAPLSDGVPLLETGLDALCFTIIVAR